MASQSFAPPPPPSYPPRPRNRTRALWWSMIAVLILLAGVAAFAVEDLRLHVNVDISDVQIQDEAHEKPSLGNLGGLMPAKSILVKLHVENGSFTPIQIVDVDCNGNLAGINLLSGQWAADMGPKPLTVHGHSSADIPVKFRLEMRSLSWHGLDLIITGRIGVRVLGLSWNIPVSKTKPIADLPEMLKRHM